MTYQYILEEETLTPKILKKYLDIFENEIGNSNYLEQTINTGTQTFELITFIYKNRIIVFIYEEEQDTPSEIYDYDKILEFIKDWGNF